MGALITLVCDGCDAQGKVNTTSRVYVLAGGATLPVFGVPAWCSECKAVVEAEVLPLPEAVESAGIVGEDLERWRAWRNTRKSGPRCFACGAAKVELPVHAAYLKYQSELESVRVAHPGCSGEFRVKSVGLAMGKGTAKRYSPEGLPL